MNRNVLMGALAVQIVLVVAVLSARGTGNATPTDLLLFDPASVDAMTISNAEGGVELLADDGHWRLQNGIPADSAKVERVLEKLAAAGGDWPIATTSSSASRFEVTDDSHQRRIVLRDGDSTLVDVFLGTSPGYQRVHARRADESDVYAIRFSNYEAGVGTSDWLDRMLLQAEGDLSVVQREGGFNLSKTADGVWVSLDGSRIDSGEVESLAGRLKGLMATGVYVGEVLADAAFSFRLSDDEGAYRLDFFRVGEDDEDFVVTTDRIEGVFEVASYVAEQLDVSIDDLNGEALEEALIEDLTVPSGTDED